jgi:two-component system phosphate regulon sensor histidine kinase PhoR
MAASAQVAMQFYPADEIRSRMAAAVEARPWTLTVSPREEQASALLASTRRQGSWLSAASVALMLVGLAFALQGSRRATQLARMQAEFVAHVSHQLKTPVSLLSAASETISLDRVRSPEKLSQFLGIVRVEVGHLSALVERILDFSRVSDGGRRYELEAVPLVALVTETVETFARSVAPVGYRLDVEPTDVRPVVAADPMALEQALVNLLDNAVKYSGESRDIQVRMRSTSSEAWIDVVDHGIGLAPSERASVFDRFYRGSGAAVHRQGFGLGLALVRELLNGQHGTVEIAESEPGRGSTFRMRIPLVRAVPRRFAWWRAVGAWWEGRRQAAKAKEAL